MPPPGRRGYRPSQQQAAKKAQILRDLAKKKADQYRQAQQVKAAAAQRRVEARNQQAYRQQEQQQRILQSRRAQEAAAQKASDQARSSARTQSRMQRAAQMRRTHTVTRTDTPESIAKQYGIEPAAVGSMVPSLRPGQRLTFDALAPQAAGADPLQGAYDAKTAADVAAAPQAGRYTGDVAGAWRGVLSASEQFAQYGGLQGRAAKWGVQLMPTLMNALGRIGITLGEGGGEFFGADTEAMGEWGERMTQLGGEMGEQEEYKRFLGLETAPADLSQYNQQRRPPGGIHDQMEEEITQAQQAKGNFGGMMRYTGQALSTAYDAMVSGDEDYERFITNSDGEVVMFLTDGRWDTGPMWEQFTPEMREKIKALGFSEVEAGLWMMPTLEEADYGMGGYTFPGYGGGFGGFGGGGGDYEYLSRGGTMRRKAGGGVSSGERYRIFPEGVSPAHWRI